MGTDKSFGAMLHEPLATASTGRRRRSGLSLSASPERIRPRGRALVVGAFLAALALVSGAFDPSGLTRQPPAEPTAAYTPVEQIRDSAALLDRGIGPYLQAVRSVQPGAESSARLASLYPSFADVIEAWTLTAANWTLPEDPAAGLPSQTQVTTLIEALRTFVAAQGPYMDSLDRCAVTGTPATRCATDEFDLAYIRLRDAAAVVVPATDTTPS